MTEHRISRRRFLGTTAAAGAGALATTGAPAQAAPPKRKRRRRKVDVVIAGGGFAGLTAAYDLMRAGRSVLVLEAQDHVGGRARNLDIGDGEISERGAGSQRIATELARRLGSRVLLRQPVRRIDQDANGVVAYCDRLKVTAKRAIVTAPPAIAARIQYDPPLRIERDQLSQNLRQGNLCKVVAVYDRPFWRDAGLNGTVVSLNGPVNVVYDDSPEDSSPGVLFGFVGGDEARTFYNRSAADRRDAVLANFESYFGPQARNATQYHETLWPAKRWHRGGPVGVAGPGTLIAHGHALREPVGVIHWAGTESSTYWAGYMDGAVRSGQRAAAEVLAAL